MSRPIVPHVGAFTTENKSAIESALSAVEVAAKTQTSAGAKGDLAMDASYLYVCTVSGAEGSGTWTRISLSW